MPRPKGSPNKRRGVLLRRLKEEFGEDFDPLVKQCEVTIKLCEQAMKHRQPAELKMAADAADKLAQYFHPKLKAIEADLTNSDDSLRAPQAIRLIPYAVGNVLEAEATEGDDKPADGAVEPEIEWSKADDAD